MQPRIISMGDIDSPMLAEIDYVLDTWLLSAPQASNIIHQTQTILTLKSCNVEYTYIVCTAIITRFRIGISTQLLMVIILVSLWL